MNLFQNRFCYFLGITGKLKAIKKLTRVLNRKSSHLNNIFTSDLYPQGFFDQAGSLAFRTYLLTYKSSHFSFHLPRPSTVEKILQLFDQTCGLSDAPEKRFLYFRWQILIRRRKVKTKMILQFI